MVGGVSAAAAAVVAAAAEARAARALQRKAPLKVHPGRSGAAAARPPAARSRLGAPGAPLPASGPAGLLAATGALTRSPARAGTLRRERRDRRRRRRRRRLAPPTPRARPSSRPRGGPARCSRRRRRRRRAAPRPPAFLLGEARVRGRGRDARAP